MISSRAWACPLLVLLLALAACDSADPLPGSPPDSPSEPPAAAVPTAVVASTPLVECPVRSTSELFHSGAVAVEGGFLLFESFPCRARRVHAFDADGALVRTDSVDVPYVLNAGPGGLYGVGTAPSGDRIPIVHYGAGGARRELATLPEPRSFTVLADGGVLLVGNRWTRLGPDGRVVWAGPAPPDGDELEPALAPDGGVVAVGCVGGATACLGPDAERVVARVGPDGATRWVARVPWDGVTGWTASAAAVLPDGGVLAAGGARGWLYGRSAEDPAVSVLRFDDDGELLWERRVRGWGRQDELVSIRSLKVVGRYAVLQGRHFDPAGAEWRVVSLVLTTEAEVVNRSPLSLRHFGDLAELGGGQWARSGFGGDGGCPRANCYGTRTLQAEVLR